MTTIARIDFMAWCPSTYAIRSFVCCVSYRSGRRLKYYGRVPAPVSRYMREGGCMVYVAPGVPYKYDVLANWPTGVIDRG